MGCCCSSCIPAKKQAAVVPIQSEWADAPTSSVLPRDDYRGKRSCLVGFMLWGMAGPGKVDYTDVPKAREKIDAAFKVPPGGIPAFKQWRELCDVEDITIAGGGGQDMVVTRIKPKKLKDTKGLAGFVNCHGGGAIMLKPEHETDWWCRMCVEADVVCYNIDFRLGPDVKYPEGSKDAVAAVEYLHANADAEGLDKAQISLFGCSGGGWIVTVAAILLGEQGKKNLVKSCFAMHAMFSDAIWKTPVEQLPSWQIKTSYRDQPQVFSLLANVDLNDRPSLDALHDDIHLFPGNMSVDQARELLPPMIVQTAEFDMLNIDTEAFVPILREAGVLADYARYAGTGHGFWCSPMFKKTYERGFADVVEAVKMHGKNGETKPGSKLQP